MPKDDINYSFTENGIVYDFYDVFVPAENFRQPSLWVWGLNSNGQLGLNDTNTRTTPVTTFAGGTTWKQISCGGSHTAAIKTDGTLWVWGRSTQGQLGINDTNGRTTPVTTFAGGTNWKSVACGVENTAAIKTDGTLWVWGSGGYGRLGTNNADNRSTPVTTFAGGTNWKQISSYRHTAAIKTDGTLWIWGKNDSNNGQLGVNDTINRSTPVTTFAGGNNWKQVSCGEDHTLAIKTDGTLWTWGRGGDGRLGTNNSTNRSTPVTTFSGGINWKSVSAGINFTAAIKIDGTLWLWGNSSFLQLGFNDTIARNQPTQILGGGTNWKSVFAGNSSTAAIKTDGTLWVWGRNDYGQLGDNTTTNRGTPVTTILGGNNWKQVSGGGSHTSAIQYQPDP